jgi:hypothetical protein
MAQLGWTNGHNVRIEARWTGGNAADTRRHAAELVALAPDVILTARAAGAGPLLQATHTVPIVFVIVPDPVGAGFVDSLSRPGGNATGFLMFEYSLCGKWLELLKEIAPGVTRAAVLMGRISSTSSAAPPLTSIVSSRAKSRPICRCRRRPGTILSSTSRPIGDRPYAVADAARARGRGDRMRLRLFRSGQGAHSCRAGTPPPGH